MVQTRPHEPGKEPAAANQQKKIAPFRRETPHGEIVFGEGSGARAEIVQGCGGAFQAEEGGGSVLHAARHDSREKPRHVGVLDKAAFILDAEGVHVEDKRVQLSRQSYRRREGDRR